MKTLILYAGKYGATCEIAERIASKLESSTVYDLKGKDIPPIAEYDCVVIGSAIYAGVICKEAKDYLSQNEGVLCSKKLGLFLSGLDSSREKAFLDSNFSQTVLSAAIAKSFLGGTFDPKKAGITDRLIMKTVSKKSEYTSNIQNEKIDAFAEGLKI